MVDGNQIRTNLGKPVDVPSVRVEQIDEDNAGQRIDNYLLARLKGVPKSHVYQIVSSGRVRVNKKRVEASYRLQAGDLVRIPPFRSGAKESNAPVRIPEQTSLLPSVIFEDESLIALDKPAGLAVHGGSGVRLGVIELLRREHPHAKFLELVHRLDRETSGILLIAKKRKALIGLHAAFRARDPAARVEKHYYVLVSGVWKNQRQHVTARLEKFHTAAGERRVSVDEAGKEAHSVFSLVRSFVETSLLDAEIMTGRTHQIRVHLSHLGFPILGDTKYGDFALNKRLQRTGLKRMFLHAYYISFVHPVTGERIELRSKLPRDLAGFVETLQTASAPSRPRPRNAVI